jgi:hypothetical protein
MARKSCRSAQTLQVVIPAIRKRVARKDSRPKTDGSAQYTIDVTLPGMLTAPAQLAIAADGVMASGRMQDVGNPRNL